jgi:hypothetical protein
MPLHRGSRRLRSDRKGWRQMAAKPSKPKSKGTTGKAKPAAGSKKKSK